MGPFVVVRIISETPIGSKRKYESVAEGLMEHQSINLLSRVMIDILSRNDDARVRRHEIIMALESTYAQQMQEKYSFSIGRLPSDLIDISDVEETRIPYRFNLSFNITFKKEKSKLVDYYDKFQKAVVYTDPQTEA
ncbi:hypothetical protein AAIR98_000059 [Elusimicrobium simillimum]|uniref:hypothetical protein n=1 Tax=Elusimicrobium simillimum TaxID=3143438 RepID=UPI003C6F72CF